MTLSFAPESEHTEIAMITKQVQFLITIPLLAAGCLQAQSRTQGLLMALGGNAREIANYRWKQRTTIVRKGSPVGVKIDEVRIDQNGQPIRFTISQPEEKHMGPLRARKAADVKSTIQEVMQLAGTYASPQQLKQIITGGETWEGQGSFRIHKRALILPADDATLTVSSSSYLPAQLEVKTVHEGNPVTVSVQYQQIANGPSMMMRMTVQIPEDDVVVRIESYDFVRLSSRAGL